MAWSKHLNFLHLSWKNCELRQKNGCYFFWLGSQPPETCKKAKSIQYSTIQYNSTSFPNPAARLVFKRSSFANSSKLNGKGKTTFVYIKDMWTLWEKRGQQLVSIANLRQKHPLQRGKVSQFKIMIHDLEFLLNILFNICCVVKCWPELSSNTALMISILIKHEIFRHSMFLF